jgi:hypothetical protein
VLQVFARNWRMTAKTRRKWPKLLNVTEDADLGYRLARFGFRSGVISPPTWEEAPVAVGAWMKQRTRWLKGHMQTWLVLMRSPWRTLHAMGLGAFASVHLVLGLGVLASLAHGPILAWLACSAFFWPAPEPFALAATGYAASILALSASSARMREPGLLRAAATMPLYWPLASLAAVRALMDLMLRPHHWAKTAHGVSQRTTIATAHRYSKAASNAQSLSTSSSGWLQDTTRRASPELAPPQS